MPWLKSGDNAATYPKVMQIAGFKDVDPDTIVNEVFGWLTRCMLQCAGHVTDYHLDVGTAYMLGGRRTDALVALCRRAKLLTPVTVDGVRMYRLIADPEFMHMRLKAEIAAEQQRQRDNRDPALTVPVTLRDGDNCRYCGVLTQWMGRTSGRSRTLDHRDGLEVPATVATLVIACNRCNGARQLNPQWDADHPLRPVPTNPQYGVQAAEFLTKNGYPTEPNVGVDVAAERPAPAVGADTAPRRVRPATGPGDATSAPTTSPGKSPGSPPEVTSEVLPRPIRSSSVGSGRDGFGTSSGGVGSERVRSDRVGPASGGAGSSDGARRRGSRGGRRRGSKGGSR